MNRFVRLLPRLNFLPRPNEPFGNRFLLRRAGLLSRRLLTVMDNREPENSNQRKHYKSSNNRSQSSAHGVSHGERTTAGGEVSGTVRVCEKWNAALCARLR